MDVFLRGTDPSYRAGATQYLALFESDPGETASLAAEADYTGYARVALTKASAWTGASSPYTNAALIQFGACTAGSNAITHFAVVDTSSGAVNMMISGALTPYAIGSMIGSTETGGALTEGGIASAVWSAAAASNANSGTMGELLNGAGGGSSPGAVADAVWAAAARTLTTLSSGITDDIANAVRAALAVELARIDAAVTTRQAAGTVNANITSVNGVAIDGSGTELNPWGPA